MKNIARELEIAEAKDIIRAANLRLDYFNGTGVFKVTPLTIWQIVTPGAIVLPPPPPPPPVSQAAIIRAEALLEAAECE